MQGLKHISDSRTGVMVIMVARTGQILSRRPVRLDDSFYSNFVIYVQSFACSASLSIILSTCGTHSSSLQSEVRCEALSSDVRPRMFGSRPFRCDFPSYLLRSNLDSPTEMSILLFSHVIWNHLRFLEIVFRHPTFHTSIQNYPEGPPHFDVRGECFAP